MSKLFISYRRDDSADVTGRLHDRLKGHFGDGTIFLDIDTIPFGMDFRQCIGDAVNQCDVLLAVIGDHWLDARYTDGPHQGGRRLDDPHDYVRIEIESALARGIPVVPLLVGKAAMPAHAHLPDGLKDLAFRHAAQARSGPDFQGQVDRLIRGLDQLLAKKRELCAGVDRAIHIAGEDPRMALGRARMVLELVVRDVYERRFHEPPGTRPLESLMQRLDSEGGLPAQLDATALLGRLSEPASAHWGETFAPADVHQSLAELTEVLKWYIEVEQPDALGQTPAQGPQPRPAATRPQPAGPSHPGVAGSEPRIAIVPKGLRSFDEHDSDFFLQLLPGPRDKEGLPDSIRFWKHRIESRDDPSFTVGVIYGPSGCGKSSLVKAGLLPRLARRVIPVYVEATPAETEARLQNGLRKKLPGLDAKLDLTQTIAALREGQGLNHGQKVVLVVDQFEQWLHARRQEQETELAQALRQCDGEHVQCLVMVRDDFWVSLTRFMGDLRIEILQGQNAALVDLFDLIHARKVLIEFGRAFGRLPASDGAITRDQETFLAQAIEGLAQDGRVISIRLALFAEMVKGKPWVAATLKEIGGTQGVGVTFLEETFRSAALRTHQKAGQAVLKALLPESGSNIKGNMRSHPELLQASGYANRPQELDALLRILDHDLRLITPTEERMKDEGGRMNAENTAADESGSSFILHPSSFRFYQLTHDYLVPSLREWLTRKQKETRRGRAELRLAERSAAWNAKPEDRHLPSLLEWLSIRRLTDSAHWSEPQRKMMRQAARRHGWRSALTLAAMIAVSAAGIVVRNRVAERQEATHIEGLVGKLVSAEPSQVPDVVKQLDANPEVARPLLARLISGKAETPDEKRAQLHARLAMVSRDPSQVEPLVEELLAGKVAYVLPIRQLLRPAEARLTARFRDLLRDDRADPERRFRAALALADYVSASEAASWTEADLKFVAGQLVSANAEYQPLLREALRPIHARLLGGLERLFADAQATDARRLGAANALADYAEKDVARLTRLLPVATPEQFARLYPIVAASRTPAAIEDLAKIAATGPPEALGSVERVAYGQRCAGAAVTLLRLGERDKVLPVFEVSDDPEALTQFIFRCRARGVGVDAPWIAWNN